MLVLARKYEDVFLSDIDTLNIKRPLIVRASEHIGEDIDIVKKLEEKGYTYVISDGVYFDTSKMPDYGKLGGLDLSNEGESRIGEQSEKKSSRDFALWKFDQNMGWESPWGKGFPGWHIECSGMSMKYLGEHFDIHTGGHDLSAIHHNNEIAQSECSTGHQFVNYWLHNEFVNVEGAKMAKSGDNFITMQTVIEKGFHPLSLRYLYLQAHYRSQVSFSWDSLQAAETALFRLAKQIQSIPETGSINEVYDQKFKQSVFDDLNTPGGIAVAWELLKDESVSLADKKATILKFDEVLGFDLEKITKDSVSIEIPEEVRELLVARQEARDQKDWNKADQIRMEIESYGLMVKDTSEGQKIEKK
jgi:cysteinyl-tRNA synthetase